MIGDNAIYEGTGWHVRGSHTASYNSNSTGIGFIGDFTGKLILLSRWYDSIFVAEIIVSVLEAEEMPTPTAIQLAKDLLQCGVELGELDRDFILLGGRQVIATESPGLELYSDLQEWDHWSATP